MSQSDGKNTALSKAFAVLDVIANSGNRMRFSQLLGATGLPKATLHRFLAALMAEQLVRFDPSDKTYSLGVKLLELARRTWEEHDVRKVAEQELLKLRDQTNESIHLAILDNLEVVYIDKYESQQSVQTRSSIGKRAPSHCTGVGKAILAFLEPAEQARAVRQLPLTKFTDNTITTPGQMMAHLEMTRERGYATDDEEHHEGIRCVAAPIFDYRGQVVASVSITAPSFRFASGRLGEFGPIAMRAAREITHKLGGATSRSRKEKIGSRLENQQA